jgi:tetratricopeptide (TPR) repeat protein
VGQLERLEALAAEVLDELVAGTPPSAFFRWSEDHGWLMRLKGDPARTLEEVDWQLLERPGAYREHNLPLLVERARLLVALGRRAEAESALEDFLRLLERPRVNYHYYSAACVLLGRLKEERGDRAGALEVWRRALPPQEGEERAAFFKRLYSNTPVINLSLLGALTGELTAEDYEDLVHGALVYLFSTMDHRFEDLSNDPRVKALKSFFALHPSFLYGVWTSRRGAEMLPQVVFRTIPYGDYLRAPALLSVAEVLSATAFEAGPSEDEETLVWTLVRELLGAFSSGELGFFELNALILAWRDGVTGALGWEAAARGLAPATRARLAYLLGRRLQRLERGPEAATLLRSALAAAPADSPLAALCEKALAVTAGR